MLELILEKVPLLSVPAFIWREKLGDEQFALLRKHWLKPATEHPHSHPCTRCNGVHRIIRHSDEDIVSVPPEGSYCKRQALSFEDVCLLRFDVHRFTEQLCSQLSITQDKKADCACFPCRIGWVKGPLRQYPVYLLLGDPARAEQAAKNLLHEDDSPFVLFAGSDIPQLVSLFKNRKCTLFSLSGISGLTAQNVVTVLTGSELFAGFIMTAEDAVYVPAHGVRIIRDYARIIFPDDHEVVLSRAPVRRSMVRFIHQWVQQKNNSVFNLHSVSAAHNERHPHHAWNTPRFKEDLFKRNESDFDRLFETLDAPNGKYRLKI